MPHAKTSRVRRPAPLGPLVFDIRSLGPGSARSETLTVPAPADLGAGMVRVPAGESLRLDVRLEGVGDGILVTAAVWAPLAGECARCLDEFTSATQVRFQELFCYTAGGSGDDGYLVDGDLLDLEPALRDAVVLELPLSPLCTADCAGLCGICGIRLADAGPDHGHADEGGPWAVLRSMFPAPAQADAAGGQDGSPGGSLDGTTGPAGVKEH